MQEVGRTKTVRVYKDPDTNRLHIGVRGTADLRDVSSWLPTAVGRLSKTKRYQEDLEYIKKVLEENPGMQADVSGHSLGGAIANQLKRDLGDRIGDVDTFNAALQPTDIFHKAENTQRYYTSGDPLYNAMGRWAVNQADTHVTPSAPSSSSSYTPGILKPALDALQAHGLTNFEAPRPTTQETRSNDPLDAFGLAPRGAAMPMY